MDTEQTKKQMKTSLDSYQSFARQKGEETRNHKKRQRILLHH